MSEPVLLVSNLTTYHGPQLCLKGVDFQAYDNEIVALVGPNGAGKTTLLETIAGLVKHRSGHVKFCNRELSGLSPLERRKRGLMVIPQEGSLFPFMSVKDNLELGAFLVDSAQKRRDLTKFVFDIFPILEKRATQMAGTMSGGEQRMLSVAMGIVSDAKLLMVDELSLGLAPKVVSGLLQVLKKIRDDTGKGIVLSEQSIKVLDVADRVFGLEAGEIRFSETTRNLSRDLIRSLYLGG